MPRMRCFFLAALIVSLLAPVAAQAAEPGTLYVQQARGGTLKLDDGHWTLTLRGAAPRVTTFSDRPSRVGGAQSLKSFVGGWGPAFGKVAPNAALEISDAPTSADVVLLELGPPTLKGDAVRYRVKPITRSSATRLADLARRADRIGHGGRAFGRSSLFIDDGSTTADCVIAWDGSVFTTQPLSVRFDAATLGFGSQIAMTNGVVQLDPSGIEARADPGAFAFMGSVGGALNLPAGGGPITGVATVPEGLNVQVEINGSAVALANGPFSLPAP